MIAKRLFKFETNLGNFYVVAGACIHIFSLSASVFRHNILTNFISPFSLFFFLFLCKLSNCLHLRTMFKFFFDKISSKKKLVKLALHLPYRAAPGLHATINTDVSSRKLVKKFQRINTRLLDGTSISCYKVSPL